MSHNERTAKISGLTVAFCMPKILGCNIYPKDLLQGFKESAEAYEQALSDYEAALDASKRVVPPAADVLLRTLKDYIEGRLSRLEKEVADLMESYKVSKPQTPTIIIFKGKGGGE
jgi:hypothetical protein